MENIVKIFADNRDIIQIALILFLATSTKVREAIAVVADMLQKAVATDPEAAMSMAIGVLRKKVPFLAFVPDTVLRWIIQSFFDGIKKQSKEEVGKIKTFNVK